METVDELIDVWKITCDGSSCWVDNEATAMEYLENESTDDAFPVTMTKEQMLKSVYDNLPEFEGF